MASERSLRARILRSFERMAARLADRVVLDTAEHGKLFGELHDIPPSKIGTVLVGAEENAFTMIPDSQRSVAGPPQVLFYGQFIPLHGIDTIVKAALSPRGSQYRWVIIGRGQEAERIDHLLESDDCSHIERTSWVDYIDLRNHMAQADICLGIFGEGKKAISVIPNKVFQALAAGKPLITADTPAMHELTGGDDPGLYLVPPGDPDGLLDALERFAAERSQLPEVLHEELVSRFSLPALTDQWRAILGEVCES
jgi:glycosyltransferase involved in cell wall biosynthesis